MHFLRGGDMEEFINGLFKGIVFGYVVAKIYSYFKYK